MLLNQNMFIIGLRLYDYIKVPPPPKKKVMYFDSLVCIVVIGNYLHGRFYFRISILLWHYITFH